MSKYTIHKIDPRVREAIRRNTAAVLPDRPSAMGMKPHEIREAFFRAIISENGKGSLADELDRVAVEACEMLELLGEYVDGLITDMNGDEQKTGGLKKAVQDLENDLTELSERSAELGTVVISAKSWTLTEGLYRAELSGSFGGDNTTTLVYPLDEESRMVAEAARIRAKGKDLTAEKFPKADISLGYARLHGRSVSDEGEVEAPAGTVHLIGIFGGTEIDREEDLPGYWIEHTEERIEEITKLQKGIGQNRFSYAVVTDTHIDGQRGLYTGHLAKKIADACEVGFVLSLGDVVSRGTIPDKETCNAQFNAFWGLMEPIRDRLLNTQGNHDGYFHNGQANYYPFDEALVNVYKGMRVKHPMCWSEGGAGYAVDDNASCTRFIMLNTCARPEGSDETSYMSTFCYTQEQYELVYWCLLTIPNERWRVVIASHVPPVWVVDRFGDGVAETDIRDQFRDAKQMVELLNAYASRSKVTISYGDVADIRYARLEADFTEAQGTLVAYHGGHYHVDKVFFAGETVNDDQVLRFPVILHRCDAFSENQGTDSPTEVALEAERVAGTATEHSFDIVTVDMDNGTIYCTKIGAGEDREISMGEMAEGGQPTYTNLADPASSDWLSDSRLSQSGSSPATLAGGTVTNYIPCKAGDVIRIRGFNPLWSDVTCSTNAAAAWFADESKTKLGALILASNVAEGAVVRVGDSDFSIDYTVGGSKEGATNNYLPTDFSGVAYMRFCGHLTGDPADVIITVNEPIE